jgi:NADH-quinone oxidoreductase subunit E
MWTGEKGDAMLTAEEKREIEEELRHYPDKQAASIEALKVVQRHRGWVSDESLRELADFMGLSPEDLDTTATFYTLIFRRPVGRHVIFICDSISCWILRYEGVLEAIRARLGIGLGETTADGRFTLLTIPCLGACDHAPAIMIDRDLHRDVRPETIGEVLERYL